MVVDRSEAFAWREPSPFNFEAQRAIAAASQALPKRPAVRKRSPVAPLPPLVSPGFWERPIGTPDFLTAEHLADLLADPEDQRAAYLAARDAEHDAEGALSGEFRPEPIRQRWVERTRKRHSCDRCRGDIEPTERARVDTVKGPEGLLSVYICEWCEHPQRGEPTAADRNGRKLWQETRSDAR
jgi:hypothetical protein